MFKFENHESLLKMLSSQISMKQKYKNIPFNEMVLLKRTINIAYYTLNCISRISFEELETALYVKTNDVSFKDFIRNYEYQIEEAKINPDKFVENLHEFYMKMGRKILKENVRDFFEFLDFLFKASKKTKYESVFDGYISLLLQQMGYLSYLSGHPEEICSGLTKENELIFTKDPYPYSDCASYDIEEILYKELKHNKMVDLNIAKKAYKKWGYDINSLEDIEKLDHVSRNFDNNLKILISYINEYTKDILPKNVFICNNHHYPRKWLNTEVYEEKLQERKYLLPSNGVLAEYKNAEMIKEILFQEMFKDDKIILLYKITTLYGDFSGYYDVSNKDFYSIYNKSNCEEIHENVKNFILENYYILTCDNIIDKKRNYKLKQVDDINKYNIEYPYQILVNYKYKKSSNKGKSSTTFYHFDREKYISEKKSINGFIRKLPLGQTASEEAKILASKLGYKLNEDETFVKPFQKYVLRIKK